MDRRTRRVDHHAPRSQGACRVTRRWALIGVLVALLLLGAWAGTASARKTQAVAEPTSAANVVPGAPGSVWFCPGPPTAAMLSSDRIVVANIGASAATVVATVRPDSGQSVQQSFSVAANSRVQRKRALLGPLGALTLESFGGEVAVEEGLNSPSQVTGGACATSASLSWYFAAGATPRAAHQWLMIDDPYATDAKVNVTIRTNEGLLQPDALQSLDIGRRSRVVVEIDKYAVLKDRVAVQVDADPNLSKVVATQMLLGANGGAAGGLGSPAAADHWVFPQQQLALDGTTWVALTNPGNADAKVAVQAMPASKEVVAPVTFSLAPESVEWVQIGSCATAADTKQCSNVPAGSQYSVDVRADEGVPIVAQLLERSATALAAPLGTITPHTEFVFPVSSVIGGGDTRLSIFDGQAAPATVAVASVQNGTATPVARLQRLVVKPGQSVTVVFTARTHVGSLVVTSNVPVAVSRTMTSRSDTTVAAGIPIG
jgi:hypothetical protein